MPWSNENKSCTRVDKSWLDITACVAKNSHQKSVVTQTRARIVTLILAFKQSNVSLGFFLMKVVFFMIFFYFLL
jgi:hypothetical protein